MEILYKVINKDYKSFNGGSFDWKPYLPKKNKPGKWLPKIKDLKICNNGYHFTKYYCMWIQSKEDIVFQVEVKNIKEWNYDKCVCQTARLIKKIDLYFLDNDNFGELNTGKFNSGNSNSGNWNSGDSNSGDRNSGDRNSGNWNSGNFNIKEPDYYELFNKPIKKEIFNNISYPDYFYFNLNTELKYKENWVNSFSNAKLEEIKQTIELPNFDYDIFEEITGISKDMIDKKLKR